MSTSLNMLGLINLELGKYKEARTQLERQLLRTRAGGDREELSMGLDLLSYLAIVEARYADAHQLLSEGMRIHQAMGEYHRLALTHVWWGYAARGLGQRAEAQHYFCKALQSAVATQSFTVLVFALPGVALLLADQGEIERAIELYAHIADLPMVANSQIRQDVAGRYLATVATPLPMEIVAAARARGQAENLWTTASALLVELSHWE